MFLNNSQKQADCGPLAHPGSDSTENKFSAHVLLIHSGRSSCYLQVMMVKHVTQHILQLFPS